MKDIYCFKNGRLREALNKDTAGLEPAAISHLTAGGALRKVSEPPSLGEGEGAVMYTGDFYVEPLEIQIEFLKADTAQKWLKALILRHTDRVRQTEEEPWIVAEIEEVKV